MIVLNFIAINYHCKTHKNILYDNKPIKYIFYKSLLSFILLGYLHHEVNCYSSYEDGLTLLLSPLGI